MGAIDTAIIEAHAGHERARRELLADIEAIERRIARDQDLAAILEVSVSIAQGKLSGARPLTLNDIYRFPSRFRSELLYEFGAWCAANNNSSSHG